MEANPEHQYEDSYQKAERLRNELSATLEDLSQFRDALDKDSGAAKSSITKREALYEENQALDKKFWDLLAEYQSLPKDDKRRETLKQQMQEQQDRSIERWKDWETELENSVSAGGDLQGTMGILEMKLKRLKEVRKEIKELEED